VAKWVLAAFGVLLFVSITTNKVAGYWAVWIRPGMRPPILNQRHTDWPWLLSWVPRSWNAWISTVGPKRLLGNIKPDDTIDIPDAGRWVVAWPPYLAATTRRNLHLRIGWRYDYIDHYYTAPAATIKRMG
jgi:hypothetical protein